MFGWIRRIAEVKSTQIKKKNNFVNVEKKEAVVME